MQFQSKITAFFGNTLQKDIFEIIGTSCCILYSFWTMDEVE